MKPWERSTLTVDVWSTTVRLEARGEAVESRAQAPFAEVVALLDDVDRWFSTWRDDTPVHALRSGAIEESAVPEVVREVIAGCRQARDLTDGAFDPWAVPGGFDPSGYVKGWAADRAVGVLLAAGLSNVSVDVGGDVAARGAAEPGRPWRVGIRHPVEHDLVAEVVEVFDGAVATSGTYERGFHVIDPRTGEPARDVVSATVVGPDAALADALATALVVAGPDGMRWLGRLPDVELWSAYVITGDTVTCTGPAFP